MSVSRSFLLYIHQIIYHRRLLNGLSIHVPFKILPIDKTITIKISSPMG